MQRVIRMWNSLPKNIIDAKSLHGFSKSLDELMEEKSCINYALLAT